MSNSIGSGVSLSSSSGLNQATTQAGERLASFTENMDSSSTADLMKMTMMQNKWSIAVQAETSYMKTIADTLKGIIQKLG